MEADFSGYATKAGLKCTDGRTIMPDAFKHQDKVTVPLVWQHTHKEPANVLGHAVLENRSDGVYTYGYFNDTESGKSAKALVDHKDISFLSIYANQLVERAKQVFHGMIREVSLVLAGANPGATIDYVAIRHSDGSVEDLEDEAVITTGLELEHEQQKVDDKTSDDKKTDDKKTDDTGPTAQDVYDSMSQEQKDLVDYMVGQAIGSTDATHSDKDDKTSRDKKDDKEGQEMKHNVFDRTDEDKKKEGHVLTHDAMKGIFADAQKRGSLNEAVEAYAVQHGIENIEGLFPEHKDIDGGAPEWVTRRMEWVAGVLNGTRKSPFSRIKTRTADLTMEEARARGYIKGSFKKEQWFTHTSRTTGPQTVYKKQKLDRDDILDITDFDVVSWIKAEMRVMLEEELARAVLIGDGRDVDDDDKIKDPAGAGDGMGIRSIVNDHELYAHPVAVELDDNDATWASYGVSLVESVLLSRRFYRGSGQPTFFTTEEILTKMLLAKDNFGRRLYADAGALATSLRVSSIVPVEVMEGQGDLVGVIVNLRDYVIASDRGGEVNLFDDFDIDYNQYKYLIETRVTGALAKIKSALVIRRRPTSDAPVDPAWPTYDPDTYVVTIPTTANVSYRDASDNSVLTAGAQPALAAGETLNVVAVPAAGYYIGAGNEYEWTFHRSVA